MPRNLAARLGCARRTAPVLLALAALLVACGSEDGGGTVTVLQTQTVAAPAESAPASDTSAAATTEAASAETSAPGTTWVSPDDTTTVPTDSAEAPATDAQEPTATAPDQFTIGSTDPSPDTGAEEPPVDSTTAPPESAEAPPAEEEPVEPGVERPADFPTKRESRLLGLLYADIANVCTRTTPDDVTKGADASIYCDVRPGDKVQAWYESFPSVAIMRKAYDRFRSGREIGPNLRSCMPSQAYPAEAPWFIGGGGPTYGRLLCFVEEGDVWLIWTDDRYGSLGWAVNRGGKKKIVWDYWRLRGFLGLASG